VDEFRSAAAPRLATARGAVSAARKAGLRGEASVVEVVFPDLGATDLVAWRLGMAGVAPFVASLLPDQRRQLEDRALELLGEPEVLIRRMVVFRART